MSINLSKIRELSKKYPVASDCRMKSKSSMDALPCYECLDSLRPLIQKELYAFNLRALLQFNTKNVSVEMRLHMLDGVSWNDIMYQDELDAINSFESEITIYRGTDSSENLPGLSWAIRKGVAA
jgi:hypothetical protein